MGEVVSIRRGGAAAARSALQSCVGAGGVAVFPADGLYGLACDPLDPDAIERIHRIKARRAGVSSAIMYFSSLAMRELLGELGDRTRSALAVLLPGAVTLVIPNPSQRYPLACREDPRRLGVRLIEGPLAGLISPIFQTSANRSGEPAPARFDQLASEIVEAVDLAIDGGALSGLASTVIDLSGFEQSGEWTILREGALPVGDLSARLAGL